MVNRGDLVRMTAHKTKLPVSTCEKVLSGLIESLIVAMAAGEEVRVKGLGTFDLRKRNPVTRKNPRTGAEMQIGSRSTVSFLPGTAIKRRLNPPAGEDRWLQAEAVIELTEEAELVDAP